MEARFLEACSHEFGVDSTVPAGHYTALVVEAVENVYIVAISILRQLKEARTVAWASFMITAGLEVLG